MKKKSFKMTSLMACILLIFACAGCGAKKETKSEAPVQEEVVVTPELEEEVVLTQEEPEEEIPTQAPEEEPTYDIIPESYAYTLTVSINPLVRLYMDESNIIVGIEYLNQDAIDAYVELDLVGTSCEEGIALMVETAAEKEYLVQEGTVSLELTEVVNTEVISDSTPLKEAQAAVEEVLESEEFAELAAVIEAEVSEEVTEQTGIVAIVTCPDCNGTGNDCKECNGTGIVNCKRCSGGYETCGICHGSGRETCHGCKGSGDPACNHCGGAGTIQCSGCGGAGGFNCSWCHGELRHVCPDCWGEGVCATCKGAGTL